MRSTAALLLLIFTRCAHGLAGNAAQPRGSSVRRASTPRADVASAAPPLTSEKLIELTQQFLDSGTGFYSPLRPELMAEDFIFRGGVVGPLNKKDYCRTMELLGVASAFDLQSNAFGFTVDPADPLCVRFFLRNTGEHVAPWQPWGALPPIPLQPTPGRTTVIAPTETGRLLFNADGQVRHFATGLVVGKYEGVQGSVNTNGLGAVLGLFNSVGVGSVGGLALYKTVRDVSNAAADRFEALRIPKTKTNAEDVPSWWME